MHEQHGSPTRAQRIQYFGPSAHTLLVGILAVQLPTPRGEGQPVASDTPLL